MNYTQTILKQKAMFEHNKNSAEIIKKQEITSQNPKEKKLQYLEQLLNKMNDGDTQLENSVATKKTTQDQQLLDLNNRGLVRSELKQTKADEKYTILDAQYNQLRKEILKDLETKANLATDEFLISQGYTNKDDKNPRREYYSDLMRQSDKKTFDEQDPRYAQLYELELATKTAYSESIKIDNDVEDAQNFGVELQSEIQTKQQETKTNLRNSIQLQIDKLKAELGESMQNVNSEIVESIDPEQQQVITENSIEDSVENNLEEINIKLNTMSYWPSRDLESKGPFNLKFIDEELRNTTNEKTKLELVTYKQVISTLLERINNGDKIKLDLDNDSTYDLIEELYIEELPKVLKENGYKGIS